MKEKIYPENAHLIDTAVKAMEEAGVTPLIAPIRGGTDGSRLSFMGLPCPNLCTGGMNYHGRYEYVCIESMEKVRGNNSQYYFAVRGAWHRKENKVRNKG